MRKALVDIILANADHFVVHLFHPTHSKLMCSTSILSSESYRFEAGDTAFNLVNKLYSGDGVIRESYGFSYEIVKRIDVLSSSTEL